MEPGILNEDSQSLVPLPHPVQGQAYVHHMSLLDIAARGKKGSEREKEKEREREGERERERGRERRRRDRRFFLFILFSYLTGYARQVALRFPPLFFSFLFLPFSFLFFPPKTLLLSSLSSFSYLSFDRRKVMDNMDKLLKVFPLPLPPPPSPLSPLPFLPPLPLTSSFLPSQEFMEISHLIKAENQLLFLSDIRALREELNKTFVQLPHYLPSSSPPSSSPVDPSLDPPIPTPPRTPTPPVSSDLTGRSSPSPSLSSSPPPPPPSRSASFDEGRGQGLLIQSGLVEEKKKKKPRLFLFY